MQSVPRTDNHPLADLPLANDSPILTTLTVNCQSLLAKNESFFNLLDTYTQKLSLVQNRGSNLTYYQVKFFQQVTLCIVETIVMAMVVFLSPVVNL